MITLKLKNYHKDEVFFLAELFEGVESTVRKEAGCPQTDCSTCEWYNICSDIGHAIGYLYEVANKRGNERGESLE